MENSRKKDEKKKNTHGAKRGEKTRGEETREEKGNKGSKEEAPKQRKKTKAKLSSTHIHFNKQTNTLTHTHTSKNVLRRTCGVSHTAGEAAMFAKKALREKFPTELRRQSTIVAIKNTKKITVTATTTVAVGGGGVRGIVDGNFRDCEDILHRISLALETAYSGFERSGKGETTDHTGPQILLVLATKKKEKGNR